MASIYKTPGVYREEIFLKPGERLQTGVPGFVGFVGSANEGEAEVALESLAPEVDLSTRPKDKPRYEPERKRLVFRGAMSCDDRKQLLGLSTERTFTEAVAALYRLSQGDAAPNAPIALHRKEEFDAKFKRRGESFLAEAVYGFFNNGGSRCYVARADECASDRQSALKTALAALEPLDDLDLLAIPDAMTLKRENKELDREAINNVQLEAIAQCARLGDRFAILDSLPGNSEKEVLDWRNSLTRVQAGPVNGSLYYPWINVYYPRMDDPKGRPIPPCGHVAGVYARTDAKVGPFKAPANEELIGVTDLEKQIDDRIQGQLNPEGVNCLRAFPGRGIRVWGARTLSVDPNWRYVNVRRLLITLRRWIDLNMTWAAFEPNEPRLWVRIRRELNGYLESLWRAGALVGQTQGQAFYVKCDTETNPPEVRDLGRVVTEIGFAPGAPAEFIVVRITHRPNGTEVS